MLLELKQRNERASACLNKGKVGKLKMKTEVLVTSSGRDFGVVMTDPILSFSFTEKTIPNVIISHRYKAQDTPARKTFEQALTGAFMSAVIKDLRPSALPFVASLIRHYTMVAVAQQCGEWGGASARVTSLGCFRSSTRTSWYFREAVWLVDFWPLLF